MGTIGKNRKLNQQVLFFLTLLNKNWGGEYNLLPSLQSIFNNNNLQLF